MKVRIIHQSNLTSECWMIQVWGLAYCKTCKFRDTDDCGGKRIRFTETNAS